MRPTRTTAPVLAASLVLLAGACGEETGTSAEEPAGETSSDASSTQEAEPAPQVDPISIESHCV